MTQYNSLNIKLSNVQLNKLKSATKTATEVILKLFLILIDHSNDKINFLHKLSLTDRQFSKFRKVFANDS